MESSKLRGSPPKKKVKTKARPKTTYFFQPTNKLSNQSNELNLQPTDSNNQIDSVKKDNSRSYNESKPEIGSPIIVDDIPQSSDDSFDGIRWDTPRKGLRRSNANSSSPLKNVTSPIKSKSSTLINEQVTSVLSKYGTGFHNILSQTPTMNRTSSDITSSESKGKRDGALPVLERSPTLIRSKTIGLDDLMIKKSSEPQNATSNSFRKPNLKHENDSLSSTLNNWIDKFDFKDSEQNTQELVEDINFEDEFSDTSNLEVEKPLSKLESDDVFSDDDLNFIDIKPITQLQPTTPLETSCNPESSNLKFNDQAQVEMSQNDIKMSHKLDIDTIDNSTNYLESKNLAKLSFKRSDFKRYQIKNILRNTYKLKNREMKQIILTVIDDSELESKLVVRGEYTELDFEINDVVNLIINSKNEKLVDDQSNLLIWNPDTLVSSTTVSQQLGCPRKTVLLNRFRFPGSSSVPLIVGTIIHLIFQSCLVNELWTDEYMRKIMNEQLLAHSTEIYSIGNEFSKVKEQISSQLDYIKYWFETYYKKMPKTVPTNQRNDQICFSVNDVLDIEENIWSPVYGIKGMVDVSLEATLKDHGVQGKFLLPMEIKTGKEHISHHAQSSLYTLMFKDRYNIDINSFLLVYTKERLTKHNTISQGDLKSLVNLRNRITKYFKQDNRDLPDLIRQSACDRCEVLSSCMTVNKLVEGGTQEESGLADGMYDSLTIHLDNNQLYKDFYNKWDEFITKEEGIINILKKDLWTLTAKEREEKGGLALANLVIVDEKINTEDCTKYVYRFERSASSCSANSLQFSQLCKNDKVIISDENGHFAIAQAFILSIRPTFIIVSSERRIASSIVRAGDFNETNNQTFQSVIHSTAKQMSERLYRIDKDEMFHGMGLARYNILNLFLHNGDHLRRECVVDLKKPKYSNKNIEFNKGELNDDQLAALSKIVNSEDYSLILGMPGTGKTTVIAKIIEHLVSLGNTVLLASYTHSAVDNILLKLLKSDVKILRVGHPFRVHKDIRKFVAGYDRNIASYEEFSKAYMEPNVVATTCLGIADVTFNLRDRFDYCIIDEASQVSMPVCLGPLRFCDKFVLVGDHYQLPPLVQHPNPQVKAGLSQSLFKILNDAQPESVVELTYQYRMCEDIMLLSNSLVYNGRLKCGSKKVADQSLYIPNPQVVNSLLSADFTSQLSESDLWLNRIFNPKNKVVFLNHDQLPGLERIVGEKVENPTEVELIHQIIEALCLAGVSEVDIGVMSLYRSQIRLLTRKLIHRPGIEILTADQFQGRDKSCIIISLVRSNKENRVGDLLKEWRRVNVAITRSKSKLILVGSKSTLQHSTTLQAFIELLADRQWICDLPPKADLFYNFPFTQSSPQKVKVSTKVSETLIEKHPLIKDVVNDITK